MSRLLYSGFRRYFMSHLFWLALTGSIVLGALSGISVKDRHVLDDWQIIAGFLMYAILLSLMIGREFSDGAFRNKIISGHTKGNIFVSEYVVALTTCLILCVIGAGVFALINISLFQRISTGLMLKSIVGFVLFIISFITITVSLCMLMAHRVVMVAVAILLVVSSCIISYTIDDKLDAPEFVQQVQMVDGDLEMENTMVKNPGYVDSPLRKQYTTIVRMIPYGQIIHYMKMAEPLFDPKNVSLVMSDEYAATLNVMPLYSVGTILMFYAIGFWGFKRKPIR